MYNFRRMGPNVNIVLDDFGNLAKKFEEAAVYQYAAMCHLGMAKCHAHLHDSLGECNSIVNAARLYLRADEASTAFGNVSRYKEAAIHAYAQAVEKCPQNGFLKEAIIREMEPHQSHYSDITTFHSLAHRISKMITVMNLCIQDCADHLKALEQVDCIIDNIYECKKVLYFEELLKEMEIYRVLLLVALNLPPDRQRPDYVKLVEYYLKVGNFELVELNGLWARGESDIWEPGQWVMFGQQYDLAEIVIAWRTYRHQDLKLSCQYFLHHYSSLTESQRCILKHIIKNSKVHL